MRAIRGALRTLYRARFPIRRMRLVDDYRGDDYASIQADNTSAFNCRRATGSTRWSDHAYGRAIDVNPIENPYVAADGSTAHVASRPFLDRSRHRRGMAYRGGVLVRAFASVGWGWGGTWPGPVDYQHFSARAASWPRASGRAPAGGRVDLRAGARGHDRAQAGRRVDRAGDAGRDDQRVAHAGHQRLAVEHRVRGALEHEPHLLAVDGVLAARAGRRACAPPRTPARTSPATARRTWS